MIVPRQDGPQGLDAFVVSEQLVTAFNTGAFSNGKPEPSSWRFIRPRAPCGPTIRWRCWRRRTSRPTSGAPSRRSASSWPPGRQAAILQAGYRPADLTIPLDGPGSPLTKENGVDPTQPQTTLQLPAPDVVQVVQNVWALTKRKTNVFLVVDTSGSMDGDKLDNAQAALKTFLAQIPTDQERVGLVEFNSGVANIIELDTLGANRVDADRCGQLAGSGR